MSFEPRSAMDSAVYLRQPSTVEKGDPPPTPNPVTDRDLGQLRTSLARYFRARVRNDSEVDDLVQEVFARVAARREGGQIEHLDRYLFQTASSVLADRARHLRSRRAELHIEFDPDYHSPSDIDPHRALSSREDLRAVTSALLVLPPRTRTVFVLHRLEGRKYREIAVQLGISVSAVEKHIARAVLHLARNCGENR